MDDNRPAGEQGSKNAVENESLEEQIGEGTERVVEEARRRLR